MYSSNKQKQCNSSEPFSTHFYSNRLLARCLPLRCESLAQVLHHLMQPVLGGAQGTAGCEFYNENLRGLCWSMISIVFISLICFFASHRAQNFLLSAIVCKDDGSFGAFPALSKPKLESAAFQRCMWRQFLGSLPKTYPCGCIASSATQLLQIHIRLA